MSPSITMDAIMRAIEQAREEAREDHQQLVNEITDMRAKVQALAQSGCGQAWQHKAREDGERSLACRVGSLEQAAAKADGRRAGQTAVVSGGMAAIALLIDWMMKK